MTAGDPLPRDVAGETVTLWPGLETPAGEVLLAILELRMRGAIVVLE